MLTGAEAADGGAHRRAAWPWRVLPLLLGLPLLVYLYHAGAHSLEPSDQPENASSQGIPRLQPRDLQTWVLQGCYVFNACSETACRDGFEPLPLAQPCILKCCPIEAERPPPQPPAEPADPPIPPVPSPPPMPPPDKVDCEELAPFHTSVANTQLEAYMREYQLPTPPIQGVERMRMGLLESYRFNTSVLSLKMGKLKLFGCRYRGRHPLSDTIVETQDKAFQSHVSYTSRIMPDSIRMELDLRFTASLQYYVQELGAPLGGGAVTLTGEGSIWVDDISIKNSDIYAGLGGAGGPISCGADITLTQMDIGGVWHGMESFYLKNGINRPDMQGIACDGKEAVNHNPFSSGWEWLGPGPRMKGVRQQLMDFLQSRCTKPGTPLAQQLIGQCWFMDGWSLAIGEMQEETAQALISAPSQVARRDDTATVRSSRSIETSAYSHEAVYSR